MEQVENVLRTIYYDERNPASFSSPLKLYQASKKIDNNITLAMVKNWIHKQDTYTLFRRAIRKFPRLATISNEVDKQWQIDLMETSWLAKHNDNIRFLLVAIDILSRFAFVEPLKDKKSSSIIEAMKRIFKRGRMPKKIETDQGREFVNDSFKNFLRKKKIVHFTTTDGSIKCALAERFIRTLRSKIIKFLYSNNTKRFIHRLNNIVHSYNNSYHRSIKMRPVEVKKSNAKQVFKNLYGESCKRKSKPTFRKNDVVRIQRKKGDFEKGSTPNFTQEMFTISNVLNREGRVVYKLKDSVGEEITSIFYPEELVLVTSHPEFYKIEKIIKCRENSKTGSREYLVKWLGYPSKFNSWVKDDDIRG